jgi:cytochrome c oxidase cbb3-type subunit 3
MRVVQILLGSATGVALLIAAKTMRPTQVAAAAPLDAKMERAVASAPGVRTAEAEDESEYEIGSPMNGRRLFLRENCYGCHGGRGGGGMCLSLRRDRPDNREAIRDGTPNGMPAFGQRLTAQEIDDLVAYILTLRTNAEPTFTHWWEPVPTR